MKKPNILPEPEKQMDKMLITEDLDSQIIEKVQEDGESLINLLLQKIENYSEEYCAYAFDDDHYSSEEQESLKGYFKDMLHEFIKTNL